MFLSCNQSQELVMAEVNAFGVEMKTMAKKTETKKQQPKQLAADSIYAHLDTDGDGVITDEEMARAKEIAEWEHKKKMQENEDAKEDQIRQMAWFALWGMLLYPLGIFVTSFFGLDDAAGLISDIAPTYFVAIAGLVAAFFGANAYAKGKSNGSDDDY
jgi:cation transport ATPase